MNKSYKEKFYVTTPIYYISGDPHLGHLYTTVAADIVSRFKKNSNYDVLFSTGSDENSQKIIKASSKLNLPPKEYVDKESLRWKTFFEDFNIEFDRFIRTTDPDHIELVQYVLKKLYDKGYIYKGKYEGWYCTECESFLPESFEKENICPECGRETIWVSEDNYFFKLSSFRKPLIEFYEANPHVIEPVTRYNEIMSMLDAELKDVSISRSSIQWGIGLPFSEDQVTYVWIDALLNYLTVPGYIRNREKFARFWPADLQLMSKDIIRFHCIIWPAILLALNLPLPTKIFVHGWWLTSGEKMSKSKGNIINPNDVVSNLSKEAGIDHKMAVDALRLFMFRESSFGEDAVFTYERFYARYNFDLANDLGNLVNRVYSMTKKYLDGVVPKPALFSDEFSKILKSSTDNYIDLMNKYDFKGSLESIWTFINYSNKLIEDTKPWELFKNNNLEKLGMLLYSLLDSIRIISIMLSPFMPSFSRVVLQSLGVKEKSIDSLFFGKLSEGLIINDTGILFPRVKIYKEEEKIAEKHEELISIDYFKNVDLRVGKVIEANRIEKSKKLILLKINVGGNQVKQIIAGIGNTYSPESLIGKNVVFVNNLEPATLMGYTSEGMVLAAEDNEKLSIIIPEKDIEPGSKIK